jgi:integrase
MDAMGCNGVQWGAMNAMVFGNNLLFVVNYSSLWVNELRNKTKKSRFAAGTTWHARGRRFGSDETKREWRKRLTKKEKAELKAWYKQYHWHPHQLRHNAATFLRKEFGLETARIILGHRSAAITEVYAELDQQKAMEAVVKVG